MENEWGAQLTAQAGLSTHAYALPISDPLKVHDLVVSQENAARNQNATHRPRRCRLAKDDTKDATVAIADCPPHYLGHDHRQRCVHAQDNAYPSSL